MTQRSKVADQNFQQRDVINQNSASRKLRNQIDGQLNINAGC
jgi:hypothetical protein